MPQRDFEAYYAAGSAWNAGADPYGLAVWPEERAIPGVLATRMEMLPFVSPPWTLTLFGTLARLPYDRARLIWWTVMLLSASALAVGSLWLAAGARGPIDVVAVCAFAVAFGPVQSAFALGQLTLVACAAAVASFMLVRRSILGTAAAFAVAFAQPNVALPLVTLIREPRARIAFAAAAGALLVLSAATGLQHDLLRYTSLLRAHEAAERCAVFQFSVASVACGFGSPSRSPRRSLGRSSRLSPALGPMRSFPRTMTGSRGAQSPAPAFRWHCRSRTTFARRRFSAGRALRAPRRELAVVSGRRRGDADRRELAQFHSDGRSRRAGSAVLPRDGLRAHGTHAGRAALPKRTCAAPGVDAARGGFALGSASSGPMARYAAARLFIACSKCGARVARRTYRRDLIGADAACAWLRSLSLIGCASLLAVALGALRCRRIAAGGCTRASAACWPRLNGRYRPSHKAVALRLTQRVERIRLIGQALRQLHLCVQEQRQGRHAGAILRARRL